MDQTIGITQPVQQGQSKRPPIWRRLTASRYVWVCAGVLLALVVVAASIRESASRLADDRIARWMNAPAASPMPAGMAADLEQRRASASLSSSLENDAAQDSSASGSAPASDSDAKPAPVTGPMIAETASLTIVPANYDGAAGAINALVAAHGGYVQKLDSGSGSDSARQTSLTLRVPAKEMDAFLADARKLGRVEAETRENEEVTDQYVDLDARLENARAAEQRLIQLLAVRTGKLEDVLDAERELTRVRGDVESMSAERGVLLHRVQYASVDIQLQEQYREAFTFGAPAGTLRNALAKGFRNLEQGAIAALAFVLAYGPSLLFWLAIFGAPAWLVWRAARRRLATPR